MKIGIVTGAFDLMHAGHVNLFRKARGRCDSLVVMLHVDPSLERKEKNTPIESLAERTFKLMSCKYIDDIYVYQTEADLRLLMQVIKPDVRFLGTDYKNDGKKRSNIDICPVKYIDSLPIHTSGIRERIKRI